MILKNIAQLIDLVAGDDGSSDVSSDVALALNWFTTVMVGVVNIDYNYRT